MRKNLVKSRKELGFTQEQLAKQLDVTTRHYNSLEAGTSDGSVKIWQQLSTIFGKSINCLLEEVEEKETNRDNPRGKGSTHL